VIVVEPAGRILDLPVARAFVPFLFPARYKGVWGGRGSAKSHEFAKNLLKRCVEKPGTRAVCVREVQRSLEQSVKRLLDDKIEAFDLKPYFRSTNTHIRAPGDGLIIFQGMQDHTADSVKSLEGFDLAWVEEAQNLSERSMTLLRPTIREPGSEIWFTWNPRNEKDPVDVLLRGPNVPPDAIVVGVTYRDNPWFPAVLKAEMEWDRRHDPEKYQHVWLGGYERHSEARVFKNWTVEEFEPPADAVFYWGADWGFSVDPSTLVRCYLDGRRLYIDRECYRIGVEIDHLPAFFDSMVCGCESPRACRAPHLHGEARRWTITADSARPETISFLNRNGYPRMVPARKGAGSVEEGIIFLQGFDIVVHPRCVHTIDELTSYSYKVDAGGNVTPVLADRQNHIIDSLRYAVEELMGQGTEVLGFPTDVPEPTIWSTFGAGGSAAKPGVSDWSGLG
jgi:phage terminase large subunit